MFQAVPVVEKEGSTHLWGTQVHGLTGGGCADNPCLEKNSPENCCLGMPAKQIQAVPLFYLFSFISSYTEKFLVTIRDQALPA